MQFIEEKEEIKQEIEEKGVDLRPKIREKVTLHLEKKFQIKKTKNPKKYYYLDKNLYRELDIDTLQHVYFMYFDEPLPKRSARLILKDFSKLVVPNKSLVNFRNVTLNTKTFEIVKSDDHTLINLDFNYIPDTNYEVNWDNPTLTQRTLQEILIPKDEPDNDLYYIDFLQRLGSCINQFDKSGRFPLYYCETCCGSSVLASIIHLIFSKTFPNIVNFDLRRNFRAGSLIGEFPIIIHELNENNFDKHVEIVKTILKSNEYGKIFGFSSRLPALNPKNNKILDIIKLPNKFMRHEEYDSCSNVSRAYIADKKLQSKIERDIVGLEWLINAAISVYKNMINEKRD